ncbi:hypothetical protein Tco_0847204 [Tanacetum coccineum]
MVSNPNLLWVKVIKAIHGEDAGLDLKGCNTNGLWSKIAGFINLLHSSGIVPKETLRIKDLQPQCLVPDRFVGGVWSFQWWREVTGRSSDLLARLMDDLNQITRLEGEDTFCWNIGSTGLFTVGATRNHIDDLMLTTMDIQTRWYKILPRKFARIWWNQMSISSSIAKWLQTYGDCLRYGDGGGGRVWRWKWGPLVVESGEGGGSEERYRLCDVAEDIE